MTVRRPLQKNRDGYRRVNNMGARPPTAAGSNTVFRPADHPFPPRSQGASDVEDKSVGIDPVSSPCYRNMQNQEVPSHQVQRCLHVEKETQGMHIFAEELSRSPSLSSHTPDIPEQLAEVIMSVVPGLEGEELADAFQWAADLPPITKQSLSELDIQNILTNIKLRHDINFDRELSFRPNLDGAKGQEKQRVAGKYWKALVAELVLYTQVFQGMSPLSTWEHADRSEIFRHTQSRVPKMFETIREVLKSLVPDRDHERVDEHLDLPKLMQEIERGVCDLARMAEWAASLLKEHCAPMRDEMADKMVQDASNGVAANNSVIIVQSLQQLLAVLEAMKLDVANHQIRSLKTLLIEETLSFERRYHLDRIVSGRSRVNIETAHQWYETVSARFRQQCSWPQRDILRLHFEVFVRGVVSTLFATDNQCNFPDTFYLDQDRLRMLKSEIDDLIHFDICFNMLSQLLKTFGYTRPIAPASRDRLRTSLSAIVGEGVGYGSSQWMMCSENVAIEIVRQALILSRCPTNLDLNVISTLNLRLRSKFQKSFHNPATRLQTCILPQVLSSVNVYFKSSPIELFDSLVTASNPSPPSTRSCRPSNTLFHYPEQLNDISNRIAHIILLHWRIWGPVAYVTEEETISPALEESNLPNRPPSPHTDSSIDPPLVTAMKTGEPPDSGSETLEYAGPSFPQP